MNDVAQKVLDKFIEYQKDKQLSEKCGLPLRDICNHDYKKTLAKSGMCFINMCHKCGDSKPWRNRNEETKTA